LKSDRQNGSIMVLTLVMLVFLELIAVTVVSSANISSYVLRNYESTVAVERGADNLINYLLGNKDYFIHYSAYLNADGEFEVPIPDDLIAKPATGKISSFKCLHHSTGAEGIPDSRVCNLNSQYWQLIVEVDNLQTGANTKVVQGLRLTVETPSERGGPEDQVGDLAYIKVQGTWWYAQ